MSCCRALNVSRRHQTLRHKQAGCASSYLRTRLHFLSHSWNGLCHGLPPADLWTSLEQPSSCLGPWCGATVLRQHRNGMAFQESMVSSDHFQRQRMWWVSFQETHLLFDCDTATGAIVSLHLLENPMLQKWEKAVKSWLGCGHGSTLLSHLNSLYPNQSRTFPPAPLQRRRTWLGDYKYVQPNWHASAAVKLLSSCASGVWGEIAHGYCKSDACTKNQAADLRVPTLQYIILNYIYNKYIYILPAHARPMVSASIPKTTPGKLRQGWTVAHPRKTKHLYQYHWASVIQI